MNATAPAWSPFGRIGFASGFDVASRPWPGPLTPAAQGPGRFPYGDAAPTATPASESDSYINAATAGQAIGAYQAQQDVRVQIATTTAEIANLEATRDRLPKMLQPVVQGRINVLQAKVTALQQKLSLAVEGEDSTRTWRGLGQTGAVVAIVAGVGVVTLLGIAIAVSIPKKNPRHRSRR